jgi:hypothetical protein
MHLSTSLATALTLAATITVLGGPAHRQQASDAGPPVERVTVSNVAGWSGASSFAPAAADDARRPAPPRAGADGHAFFPPNRHGRVVVSWDRDIPVTFLIARRHARPRMFTTIKEAFRRARVQTGVRFGYGGRAATSAPVGTPDHPVVIVDFGTARDHPRLAKYPGVVYAVGGPFLTTDGTTGEFTGGQVTINVTTTRGLGRGFRHSQLGVTLLHEVGHVLGLAHVGDPEQLMAPGQLRANISGWFHDGDLRGLDHLVHD